MMKIIKLNALVIAITVCLGFQTISAAEPVIEVVKKSEVKWSPLNPLRGDKSPKAGTLWGGPKRKSPIATGFLVQFADGFSSPPHIHNTTYRGVVINGLIHNDDPEAAEMWIPAGSFWTQPAGEVHITAAKGLTNMAYIEIDYGPYLVLSAEEAFDRRERPINIHASNIVWVDQADGPDYTSRSKIAYLWGNTEDGKLNGTLIKLPAGFNGKIKSHGLIFRAVVIKGLLDYKMNSNEVKVLEPGSYFGSKGASAVHVVSSNSKDETIVYVRTNNKYDVIQDSQ